jgi:mono/diheme cytochrome c family protein
MDPHRKISAFCAACIWALIAIGFVGFARAADSSPAKDEAAIRQQGEQVFREQIVPLLKAHCQRCHSTEKNHGSLILDPQLNKLPSTESGEEVAEVPIVQNELWRRVTSDDPEERMPMEAAPLSQAELASIRQWAEAGAPWPVELETVAPTPAVQKASAPWWARALSVIDPIARYVERFGDYAPAGYLLLVMLCVTAFSERVRQSVKRRGELAKPWQRRWCGVVNRTFYLGCVAALITCVLLLHIRELYKPNANLEASQIALRASLDRELQINSANAGDKLAAYYFPQPKQLGGTYYRGNDERNDALFNAGRYRTCTFTVSLCDAARKPLAVGDTVPPGPLYVRLEIQRAPFATKTLFSKRVIDSTFISPLKTMDKVTDAAKQIVKFSTLKLGDRWEAFAPIAEIESAAPPEKLADTLYLYNGGQGGPEIAPPPSYTLQYDLKFAAGKILPDSNLRMGVVFIPGNFAVPPPDKDAITEWFDIRPIPEIVGGNTTDPTLLGIKPHEQRLGPLEDKPEDDAKK